MTSFNGALEELRCERLKLEADLKTTDLRKLVLVQELRLLKEFEKNDITLASPNPNPNPYPNPNPNPTLTLNLTLTLTLPLPLP